MRRAEQAFFKIKFSTFRQVIAKNNPFKKEFLKEIEDKSKGLTNLKNKQIIIGTDGTRILTRKIYGRKSIISHGLCSSGFTEDWVQDFYDALLWELKKKYYSRIQSNPIFLLIVERIAYFTAKLKYADVNPKTIDTQFYANIYNSYMKTLFNCLDQLMKYTEIKTTLSKSKGDEIDGQTETLKIRGMTVDELKAKAHQLIGSRREGITDNIGRTRETEQ